MCLVIPARPAAGRTPFLIKLSGQYGCFPSFYGLPKMKSPSWLYAHFPRQSTSTLASAASIGTGFSLTSVLERPSHLVNMAQHGRISISSKCTSSHFKPNSSDVAHRVIVERVHNVSDFSPG